MGLFYIAWRVELIKLSHAVDIGLESCGLVWGLMLDMVVWGHLAVLEEIFSGRRNLGWFMGASHGADVLGLTWFDNHATYTL